MISTFCLIRNQLLAEGQTFDPNWGWSYISAVLAWCLHWGKYLTASWHKNTIYHSFLRRDTAKVLPGSGSGLTWTRVSSGSTGRTGSPTTSRARTVSSSGSTTTYSSPGSGTSSGMTLAALMPIIIFVRMSVMLCRTNKEQTELHNKVFHWFMRDAVVALFDFWMFLKLA